METEPRRPKKIWIKREVENKKMYQTEMMIFWENYDTKKCPVHLHTQENPYVTHEFCAQNQSRQGSILSHNVPLHHVHNFDHLADSVLCTWAVTTCKDHRYTYHLRYQNSTKTSHISEVERDHRSRIFDIHGLQPAGSIIFLTCIIHNRSWKWFDHVFNGETYKQYFAGELNIPVFLDNDCTVPIMPKSYYDSHKILYKFQKVSSFDCMVMHKDNDDIEVHFWIGILLMMQEIALQLQLLVCDTKA